MSSRPIALAASIALVMLASSPPRHAAAEAPLSTTQALRTAADNNPQLRAAALELRRAGLLIDSEQARLSPTLTADAGFRRQRLPTLGPAGVVFLDSESITASAGVRHTFPVGTTVRAGLDAERSVQNSIILGDLGSVYGLNFILELRQPWLRGFGRDVVESQLRLAKIQREQADAQLAQTTSALARDVLSAYWQVWLAQRQLDIQRAALEVAERELADGLRRHQAGAIAESDLIPIRTQIASINEQLVTARASLEQQRVELARLMGIELSQLGELAPGADVDAPGELPTLEAAVARAEDASYQLKQLQRAVDAARLEAQLADNETRAQLDSTASLRVAGLEREIPPILAQVGTLDGWAATVGLSLELPLVNTFATARAERAALAIARAEADYEDAAATLRAQIANLLTTLRATEQRLELTQQTAALTADLVAAETARFKSGQGTALDVAQAIQQQREAELRVVQARVDLATTRLALDDLTGALLPRLGLEP